MLFFNTLNFFAHRIGQLLYALIKSQICKIKGDLMVYIPVENACYETFLTALSTIWMYDGLVYNLSDFYNVTYCRSQFIVSMCGMEYGNASYIHCPDPLMGISLSGDSWINVYIVRYLSSLMLGEIESSVLNIAGGHCNSSVYEIFSRILNFENFTVSVNENIIEIYLNNDSNNRFVIDLENGTVYDLTFYNGFIYKGAISLDFNYCYCYSYISDNLDDLTSEEYPPIYNENNTNLTITDDEWNIIEDILGDFAISASFAAITPFIPIIIATASLTIVGFPIAVAACLLVVGCYFKFASNDFNINKSIEEISISIISNIATI